jgi:tetratricopeptide (TPR) repeat protein
VLYDWKNQKILKVKNEIAGVKHPRYATTPDDEPWDKPIYKSKDQYEKANIAIRGIIMKVIVDDFNYSYEDALINHKKGDRIKSGEESMYIIKYKYIQTIYPVQRSNVGRYNDFGYFLEQAGLYEQAVELLVKVTTSFPSRAVAYINLGDAYFGMNEIEKSKKAYTTYVNLMNKAGKGSRIPAYVLERLD